jgi:hypothetical protein
MSPIRLTFIFFLFVFGGGAALAPVIHSFLALLGNWIPFLEEWRRDIPFRRLVNRGLIITALIGLWPFLRKLEIRNLKGIGLQRNGHSWRNYCLGFGLGCFTLGIAGAVVLVGGGRQLKDLKPIGEYFQHVINAGMAAVAVGFLEEILFRGALLGALLKRYTFPTALGVSSALYAIVHFFKESESPEIVSWWSGFKVLADMCSGFFEWYQLVPGFLNLTLVGMILGVFYGKTGTLYFSIGLHGGWVFLGKTYRFLTGSVPDADPWLWGSRKLVDGWMVTFVLVILLWYSVRRQKSVIAYPDEPKNETDNKMVS